MSRHLDDGPKSVNSKVHALVLAQGITSQLESRVSLAVAPCQAEREGLRAGGGRAQWLLLH